MPFMRPGSHMADYAVQRRKLWALFVTHGSKYGWGQTKTRRLLMLVAVVQCEQELCEK